MLLLTIILTSLLHLHRPFSVQANMYLIRLIIFLLLGSINLQQKSVVPIYIAQIVFIFWGFIQYFIWPNNVILSQLGWDPHTNRLIGSLLDPTYTGLVLTLFTLWNLFYSKSMRWLAILSYFSLALTYSRSSLLSLYLPLAYLIIRKHKLINLAYLFLLLFSTIYLLPKPPGESTNLTRSNSLYAKIENYKEGLQIFKQSPFFGVGLNNLGFYRQAQNHAQWGFDSSMLTIICTIGLFGLFFLFLYMASLWPTKTRYQKLLFLSCLVHSFFSNSLLNPWIIFLLLFLPPPTTAHK